MNNQNNMLPFPNCPALDGYHCQTNSLAKIFHFYQCPLSEDMLLGLGAGMGFIFWHQKGTYPFIGGRSNLKSFYYDLGKRTSVTITEKTTTSAQKAEEILIKQLEKKIPVMMYGDMGMLPWFDFPDDYHFGGHTFVICGFDGEQTVLASDMDPKDTGLKRGIYSPISLKELRKARNSGFKPFPPKNIWLEFDFSHFKYPDVQDIISAIKQTADAMLNPPISNVGLKGFYRTAKELEKWPQLFNDKMLRLYLFNLYIFIEVGGTGGGCFRYMYSRFLKEAFDIVSNKALLETSELINDSGEIFTNIGLLFKDIESSLNYRTEIQQASEMLRKAAKVEEKAFRQLIDNLD